MLTDLLGVHFMTAAGLTCSDIDGQCTSMCVRFSQATTIDRYCWALWRDAKCKQRPQQQECVRLQA